jgi:hypothetical protein
MSSTGFSEQLGRINGPLSLPTRASPSCLNKPERFAHGPKGDKKVGFLRDSFSKNHESLPSLDNRHFLLQARYSNLHRPPNISLRINVFLQLSVICFPQTQDMRKPSCPCPASQDQNHDLQPCVGMLGENSVLPRSRNSDLDML